MLFRSHRSLRLTLAEPSLIKKYELEGVEVVGNTPTEFQQLIETELKQWVDVVKRAKIKAD